MIYPRLPRLSPAVLLAALACQPAEPGAEPAGATPRMDYASPDFFAKPFPDAARVDASGQVSLAGWPNPDKIAFVDTLIALIDAQHDGFSTTATLYLAFDAPLDASTLPTLAETLSPNANVQLVDVDPDSPERGRRFPLDLQFLADGGPFGAPNLLAALPLQGQPLHPARRYALLVMRDLQDADGLPLGQADALSTLLSGETPPGMSDQAAADAQAALTQLEDEGMDTAQLSALLTFTTGSPRAGLEAGVRAARARPAPALTGGWQQTQVFPEFCVYEATLPMPSYQTGDAPFLTTGGGFTLDETGTPIYQQDELARVIATVPRTPAPPAGFPVAVLIRTGAGGDRALVERGVRGENGGPALIDGTGPALHFAEAGYVGISVDGPLGGLRNLSGGDEQFLVFNLLNPLALRDNLRQSALELALLPTLLPDWQLPTSDCAGAPTQTTLDTRTLALVGHSMGATIAPLVVANAPEYDALILSGAGGSWIENLVYKALPLETRPLAEGLIGFDARGRRLETHDPVLSLVQWAGEPADPPVYAPGAAPTHMPHVMMVQGIVDHYILPPIANTTSLSMGLDLAGPALDSETPELAQHTPLAALLPLVGQGTQDLPADANATNVQGLPRTAIVVQLAADGVEDGHEVFWQLPAAHGALRCFLSDLAEGPAPRVMLDVDAGSPCPAR